jgi:hypothetical protein
MKMFEVWECVIMDDQISPLFLIEKTTNIEEAKILIQGNKKLIIWDDKNKTIINS